MLSRAMAEMPFHPKAALWLAERLLREPPAPWSAEVKAGRATLAAERAAGTEGTT